MAASTALLGYGTKLQYETTPGGGTYTDFAEVTEVNPPGFDDDTEDVTHMLSPSGMREFIPTLGDNGEISGEMNFLSTEYATIMSLRRTKRNYRVILPNAGATTATFAGILTSYEPSAPVDGKMTASFTIKVSGVVTIV